MDIIREITQKQINPNVPEFRVGDTVKVVSCRPLSKTKRYVLDSIVEEAVIL